MDDKNIKEKVNACFEQIKEKGVPKYDMNGVLPRCPLSFVSSKDKDKAINDVADILQEKIQCPYLGKIFDRALYAQQPGYCLNCTYNKEDN